MRRPIRFSPRLVRHSRRICGNVFNQICRHRRNYILPNYCYMVNNNRGRNHPFPGNGGIIRAINQFHANLYLYRNYTVKCRKYC